MVVGFNMVFVETARHGTLLEYMLKVELTGFPQPFSHWSDRKDSMKIPSVKFGQL
jgi:hypothetical protein